MKPARVLVAMTGASGATYCLRLVRELLAAEVGVTFCVSPNGTLVCREETGVDPFRLEEWLRSGGADVSRIKTVPYDDLFHPAASGSSFPDAMVIAPCSMGTLSRISSGNSGNLIERSADVALKEKRPLVLVPRETPLNLIHMENMLRAAKAGAIILPAMPAFYSKPESLGDLVDFVAGKILDQLEVPHRLFRRWGA